MLFVSWIDHSLEVPNTIGVPQAVKVIELALTPRPWVECFVRMGSSVPFPVIPFLDMNLI